MAAFKVFRIRGAEPLALSINDRSLTLGRAWGNGNEDDKKGLKKVKT